jgi:hypothetical protein
MLTIVAERSAAVLEGAEMRTFIKLTLGALYATVASLRGVPELDKLDAERLAVIARGAAGLDLRILPLP